MENLQPKLRFPEFRDNWKSFKLKELILNSSLGGNYDNKDIVTSVPLIKMGNIGRGKILLDKIQYVPESINIDKSHILKQGDFLFNTRNTLDLVGKVSIWRNELVYAVYNSNLLRIKFNILIEESNQFINQIFNLDSTYSKLKSIATGTTSVAAIYNKDLVNVKIIIPTLQEQTKIADFLGAVDKQLDILNQKKEKLNLYKKGVMQQLFSQQIRFKDDNGNNFPKWEEKTLGEVCTFFSGGTPTSTNASFYGGRIPFIKSGEISSSKTEQFLSEDGLDKSSAKLVNKGDLLYALYGATSGQVAISKIDGAINQAVLCIRSKYISMLYLKELLFFNKQSIVDKYIQGGQGNLSAAIIRKLEFNIPTLQEQTKIAEFLSAIDTQIQAVENQITKTETYKKGLLQQMFV